MNDSDHEDFEQLESLLAAMQQSVPSAALRNRVLESANMRHDSMAWMRQTAAIAALLFLAVNFSMSLAMRAAITSSYSSGESQSDIATYGGNVPRAGYAFPGATTIVPFQIPSKMESQP